MWRPKYIKVKNILTYEDETFPYRQGQALVAIGENKDDPGQKGNGAGKSGVLVEAMAVAVIGSAIRKNIKTKELVRRGCDDGEVEVCFENGMLNSTLTIWRKIYAGSKSGEYKAVQDKVDMKEHYADSDEFNAFVFKALGVSKEDFFNFFLITKERYIPFLSVGDTEKKKVVNRFSGAEKVDGAIPFIETDLKAIEGEKREIELKIASVKGKQQLITEQIKDEEAANDEENQKEERERINGLIESENRNKNSFQAGIDVNNTTIGAYRLDLLKIPEADTKSKQKLVKDYDDSVEKYKQYEKQLEGAKKRKTETEELRATIMTELAGVVTCPKCAEQFSVVEDDYDVQDAQATVKEIDEELMPDIKEDINIAVDLIELQKEDKEKKWKAIQDFDAAELLNTRKRNDINNKIKQLEQQIQTNERQIKEVDKRIEKHQSALEVEDNAEVIEELNNKLMDLVDEETELQEKLEETEQRRIAKDKWITNFKGFKSFLANKSIGNIQDYANLYLQSMGSNIQIIIEGYRMLANKKLKEEIQTVVRRNGIEDASYGTFSGGERGRIDITVILAIQTLININSTTGGLDLLVLDEVMDSVDSLGLENIVGALQNLDRTIMIVSQNEINSLSEFTIIIRKQNKISKIVNGKQQPDCEPSRLPVHESTSSTVSKKRRSKGTAVRNNTNLQSSEV